MGFIWFINSITLWILGLVYNQNQDKKFNLKGMLRLAEKQFRIEADQVESCMPRMNNKNDREVSRTQIIVFRKSDEWTPLQWHSIIKFNNSFS